MLFHVLKQVFFIFADKKTKRPASLRFKCFHNGIILIVNCCISCAAKIGIFPILQEFFEKNSNFDRNLN